MNLKEMLKSLSERNISLRKPAVRKIIFFNTYAFVFYSDSIFDLKIVVNTAKQILPSLTIKNCLIFFQKQFTKPCDFIGTSRS